MGKASTSVHAEGVVTYLVAHPSSELYGSDRVMLETVLALTETGGRVVVALPADGPLAPEVRERGGEVIFSRSPVLRKSMLRPLGLARLLGQSISALVTGTRVIRRLHPSVLYVSTMTIPVWLLIGSINRVPVICHVHEAEGSASAILRRGLVAPLGLAQSIVANSNYSVEVLRRSSSRAARKAQVIYNGVWGPPSATRQMSSSGLRVVYVGRLSSRKGVDVAVAAIAGLRSLGIDASLDIVGDVFPGYEWYRAELDSMVERDQTSEHIRFHGFQPLVWPHLARADVVIVPSRIDEPFGNTAVEAILAARPVVVSSTSGLMEAAAGYSSAQFVTAGDVADAVGALRRISDDRQAFFDAAFADREIAMRRHAPARYREAIASAIRLTGAAVL